jgi:ribosomal protein L18
MKALLIGSLVAILLIIGGAVTFMIIDSANTIDAQVVTKTTEKPVEKAPVTAQVVNTPALQDTTTATSAKDALNDLKNNGNIAPATTNTDAAKTGFTFGYQAQQNQNVCDDLIAFKQDDFDEADEDYKDAKKVYEKAQERMDGLEDDDAIQEAQERIKDRKEELDDAEQTLFNAREELINARTSCQS